MKPLAIYVHVPFCPTKCGYCDFNSYAMDGDIVEQTTEAMLREIRQSPWRGRPASTIFFGGGTPTFLAADALVGLLRGVMEVHPPLDGCEITSEANPGTVDASKFRAMRQGGFNRVSLGAQSFLNSDLITLGRVHRAGEIERAVLAAREAGFDNLNVDLMFALPDQSVHAWNANLDRALALRPDHISLYCLTIEPNTAFYKKNLRGELALPDDEAQVEMYDECVRRTHEAGFRHYEISNFALPGRECRHNLAYWAAEEYAGYGPGAVGAVDIDGVRRRATNLKHPERYVDAVNRGIPLGYDPEDLDTRTLRTETIMLGLRMNDGFSPDGLNLEAKTLNELTARGWIEPDKLRIRLTPEGRHFCSEVALALI
ncbi:MAG: radical SAM family heme chaperone HemW [Fimbriimonas sp.]